MKVHETSHETAVHDAVLVACMAAKPAPAGCRNRTLSSDKRSTMTSPSGTEGEVPKESVIDSMAGTSAEASRTSVRSCSVTTVTFVPGVHAVEGTLRKASWSLALEARSRSRPRRLDRSRPTSNGCSVAVLLAWRAFNAASTTAEVQRHPAFADRAQRHHLNRNHGGW